MKQRPLNEFTQTSRVWFSVFLALNLINLPNLVACCYWLPASQWLFSLVLPLLACAFGMRVRLMLWLAIPFILLVPACLACLLSIQNLPSTFLILALLETNQAELSAFQAPVIMTGLGTLLLLALYVVFVKSRVPADYRLGLVGRLLVFFTLLVPAVWDLTFYGQIVSVGAIKERFLSTFPSSTLYYGYEALSIRSRVQNRQDLLQQLTVSQEPEFRNDPHRQVHMMVIGESAAKSCFSLYGYERETTPLLEKTPGLLPFREVASTATVTLVAVPTLLTSSPAGKVIEATRQPSTLSAYKKAGFRVYWLSAQKKHGTFDTLTSIFSTDADEAVFLGGKIDLEGKGIYDATDASLLPLVRGILQRNEPKVLFVLHTIGSHGPYPARYAQEQTRFPAPKEAVTLALQRIRSGMAGDPQDLELVQNSYDNTICTTDFLLSSLISDLKQIQASSWLCYISDHGENTSKARLGKFMHGMVSRQVIEVPMLMWVSPLYEQAHAGKMAGLKAHLNTPFSATCTFHTLLDMGGLSCPDFKPEWSAASPRFAPGPRLVCDPKGTVIDYDQRFPARQDVSQVPPLQTQKLAPSVTGP
ncbi:phosphoethanolamine transferase [Prosthecobacter sp.]|uniref:phosphoethanolamine transferase n=1 Tax=Prosthecobacter sp. TaxID=1965333 RepID=UPI00248898FB|nr:phosphoethanolamine transferase [Prosthecobacter sp.]MDI1312836.1 phosphoethanolamine transferase [Prosthecobacter sp.]